MFETHLIGGAVIFGALVAFCLLWVLPCAVALMTWPRPNGWY